MAAKAMASSSRKMVRMYLCIIQVLIPPDSNLLMKATR
jgi:hypothetical protein